MEWIKKFNRSKSFCQLIPCLDTLKKDTFMTPKKEAAPFSTPSTPAGTSPMTKEETPIEDQASLPPPVPKETVTFRVDASNTAGFQNLVDFLIRVLRRKDFHGFFAHPPTGESLYPTKISHWFWTCNTCSYILNGHKFISLVPIFFHFDHFSISPPYFTLDSPSLTHPETLCPGYFSQVESRMDLDLIQQRFESGAYQDLASFRADAMLLFDNAIK